MTTKSGNISVPDKQLHSASAAPVRQLARVHSPTIEQRAVEHIVRHRTIRSTAVSLRYPIVHPARSAEHHARNARTYCSFSRFSLQTTFAQRLITCFSVLSYFHIRY